MTTRRLLLAPALLPALHRGACATTAPSLVSSAGKAGTAAGADAAAKPAFPALRAPARLRDDGKLERRVHDWRGGRVVADVRLCVAPDGSVADVALSRSSGLAAYDHALVASASQWTYEPYAGDAARCKDVAVAYVAP